MTSDPSVTDRTAERSEDPAVEAAVEAALARLDLAARVHLLTGSDFWQLYPAAEAGLRPIVLSDGPAGVKGGSADLSETTTSLPSPTALAASWDETLVAELGGLLAEEARRKGVDVLLGPTINLHRSPLGGRHFEAFSEDPLLTGRMAVAYVRGLQARGVGGCPKHYVCNDSETERHTLRVQIDERPLHEVYLAPFERVVREAAAWTLMAAYNGVGETTMTESPLLADPLEREWGFDGVVMSDWYATKSTVPSAQAALDLVMPGPDGPWGERLLAAVRDGVVSEAAIERKVRRLLRLAARVGALEGVAPARPRAGRRPQSEVAALVRRASAAGSVLLRNDGLLPLDAARVRRIAVLGPGAASEPGQGGGSANLRPDYTVTPIEGLAAALGPNVELLTSEADRARPGLQTVTSRQVRLPAIAGDAAGKPGVLARIFEGPSDPATDPGRTDLMRDAGRELVRQHRADGRVDWHGDPYMAGFRIVEVATSLVSEVSGRHRIGFSTRGHVAVWIDGKQVVDEVSLPEAGSDHDAIWRNPPRYAVDVEMTAGRPVEFVARWQKWYAHRDGSLFILLEQPAFTPQQRLADAERLAAAADVAVVCIGTTKDEESEGFDRTSLSLQPLQDELVRRVAAVNPRTVAVLAAGSPVLMPWRDEVAALLLTWFPGQEAGNALADMLLGRVEPGGRLPTSWPASAADAPVLDTKPVRGELHYAEGIHVGHRGWLRDGREPAFPFGHGLGFTGWEYLAAQPVESPEPAVRVRLRNAGSRRGREVVELFISRPDSAIERPARWLGGFAAVEAGPGETVEVVVPVDRWALRHWDTSAGSWAVEPGTFNVSVGRSVADLRLETAVDVRAATE